MLLQYLHHRDYKTCVLVTPTLLPYPSVLLYLYTSADPR